MDDRTLSVEEAPAEEAPAEGGQWFPVTPGYKICIVPLMYWCFSAFSEATDRECCAHAIREYLGVMYQVWIEPQKIARYYYEIRLAVRAAMVNGQRSDTIALGLFIANKVKDSETYGKMTAFPLEAIEKKLSGDANKCLKKAIAKREEETDKDFLVLAAWDTFITRSKDRKPPVPIPPVEDFELLGWYNKNRLTPNIAPTPIEQVALQSDFYLASPEDEAD